MTAEQRISRHLPQIKHRPDKLTISDACKVDITCGSCNTIVKISVRNLIRRWADEDYLCKSCHVKTYANNPSKIKKFKKSFAKTAATEEHKQRTSRAAKKLWANPVLRKTVTEAVREDNKTNPKKAKAREVARRAWMKKHGRKKLLEMMDKGHEAIRVKCASDPAFRDGLVQQFRDAWEDKDVVRRHREATSVASIRRWRDPRYRAKMRAIQGSDAYRKALSERSRLMWGDPRYRARMEKLYADPVYKAKLSAISREVNSRESVKKAKAKALARSGSVSKLEDILAGVLDDLGVKYVRQFVLGWYTFDFMISRDGCNLLVEVNGTYFHSLPKQKANDAAKASFVKEYHSDKYELRTIWEHEFGSPERVGNIIGQWLDPSIDIVDFDFSNVTLVVPEDSLDSRIFLSKYHYLGRIGRHGLLVEFRLDDKLIGCITFATVTRKQTAERFGCGVREVYELARLCIHPNYQKKNLASWMISRAVKLLWKMKASAKYVVSFADPLYGHEGTVYKAAGWRFDGMTSVSYFYRHVDGFVMHKKTLYNNAVKGKMREHEFADKFGYTKVNVPPKNRYVICR